MKKIVCVLLTLLTLIPCLAFADGPDYSSMTADELRAVIADARAALARLDLPFDGSRIIYDDNGITVSIDGFRFDSSKWLYVDMTVINRSEYDIHFELENTYINGWKVSDSETTIFNVSAKKNSRDSIRFINFVDETQLSEIDQIEDFTFTPIVKEASNWSTLFKGEEITMQVN